MFGEGLVWLELVTTREFGLDAGVLEAIISIFLASFNFKESASSKHTAGLM